MASHTLPVRRVEQNAFVARGIGRTEVESLLAAVAALAAP